MRSWSVACSSIAAQSSAVSPSITSTSLAIENIDHTRTKARSPQTNGICESFHKTLLDEFYRVAFRKKLYRTIAELQRDLDAWLTEYSQRPHQGRWCYGKTPRQTFIIDTLPVAKETRRN